MMATLRALCAGSATVCFGPLGWSLSPQAHRTLYPLPPFPPTHIGAGILLQADYLNLIQCETLDDLKLQLQMTDYGNFLSSEPSPLAVSTIDDKLKDKMVSEFRHIRNQCVEPLATFLDYITCVALSSGGGGRGVGKDNFGCISCGCCSNV